jgi:hypothetical protein
MTTRLPAIKLTQGEVFTSTFTVVGQDWTGYTGEVVYKKSPQGEAIFNDTATGNASGVVSFGMTAEETALFPAFPVLGYRKVGVYQVTMTRFSPRDVRRYQGDLHVASAV